MDDATDISPLVEELGESIEDLEAALKPLLETPLTDTVSKLALLEKAKLQVLVAYAIESVLFSTLRLNGVDARQHPVFNELTRVKQYFEKIKEVEEGGPKKRENLRLDKGAAGRMIKNALASNPTDEKPNTHVKFDQMTEDVGSHQRFKSLSKKREVDDTSTPENSQHESIGQPSSKSKKQRPNEVGSSPLQTDSTPATGSETQSNKKRHKKDKKHRSSKVPKSGSAVFQDLLNKPLSRKNDT